VASGVAALVIAGVVWSRGAPPPTVAITALFAAAMISVAIIDLRSRRIPNVVTLPGMVLALILASLSGVEALTSAGLGASMAIGVTGVAYVAARGQFGMGDVKLAGLGGAVLGLGTVPVYLVLASLLAAVVAAAMLARGASRSATMAYGPYLAAAGILCCCALGPVAG